MARGDGQRQACGCPKMRSYALSRHDALRLGSLVTRCLNDSDFQEVVFAGLVKGIFDAVAAQQTPMN